jgi:hypothetical protein
MRSGAMGGVGVHDQHHLLGVGPGQETAEHLVEWPRLLLRVADGLDDLDPAVPASPTVRSVQLSAMTRTRSAGRVCVSRESRALPSTASSFYAGMRTVQRSRAPWSSWVSSGEDLHR